MKKKEGEHSRVRPSEWMFKGNVTYSIIHSNGIFVNTPACMLEWGI
jgi:hypothetical protein